MPYPYVPSGGILQQAIDQFKKALPAKVDSTTLKKLGIAPSNEGYVINTIKFLGIVDDGNDRTQRGIDLFSIHGDEKFSEEFGVIVREKYNELFDMQGEDAWGLDRDALISFFRGSDKSSAIVGGRQALTFAALASMAGKRDAIVTRSPKAAGQAAKSATKQPNRKPKEVVEPSRVLVSEKVAGNGAGDVALTVRIEINLPANGTQATYDNIFKSIRENLLNQNA